MASKINNFLNSSVSPTTLMPNQVISLRNFGKAATVSKPFGHFGLNSLSHKEETPINEALLHYPASASNHEKLEADKYEIGTESVQALEVLPDSLPLSADTIPLSDFPLPYTSALTAETAYETDVDRLRTITRGAQDVLLSVSTVLPLKIQPSTLTVDRQKLTIVHRTFWGSTDTISVQMNDIHNVEAFVGPFFGEIRIFSKYFISNAQTLAGLKRKDAIAVRRLIQGYMIAHNRGIDCSVIEDKEQLIELLMDLGRGSH